jgi:isocitrate/isopropylmalate dehydrogenase
MGIPTYRIASIPADGIGPEVIDAGVTVLKKLSETLKTFNLDFTNLNWSSDTYKKTGRYLPENALETLKKFDAILFGAVGAPGKWDLHCLPDRLPNYNRRPGPHFPVATPSCHMPAATAIC